MAGTDNRADVGYERVSLDKSGAAAGVESQEIEIEDFTADELGLMLTEHYQDNSKSAFSGVERPEYQRLLGDMAAGLIRSVTVWHANRLHRSLEEVTAFIRLARKHKVKLYSVARGGEYNLERVEGRKALLGDTLDAQSESEHRGERVALARKRQARRGDYGGGLRPYGWGVDTGRVRSVCVNPKAPTAERVYEDRPVLDMTRHNPEEAEEIQRWARELLAGVKLTALVGDLNRRGVQTVVQKEGRARRRGGKEVKSRGWNGQTVRQILTSPRVSGHTVYQGEIMKRDVLPSILPEQTRQALITLFADPTRKKSPGNTPKWLGSLIYRCGECNDGSTLTCFYSRGARVYRCQSRGHCQWPADMLDTYITEVIINRLSRDDVADLIPRKGAPVDIPALREERRALELSKKEAAMAKARRTIDMETLETVCATADADIAAIDAKIKAATQESPLSPFLNTPDVRATWNKLSLGRKREVLRTLAVVTLPTAGRGRKVHLDMVQVTRPPQPIGPQADAA